MWRQPSLCSIEKGTLRLLVLSVFFETVERHSASIVRRETKTKVLPYINNTFLTSCNCSIGQPSKIPAFASRVFFSDRSPYVMHSTDGLKSKLCVKPKDSGSTSAELDSAAFMWRLHRPAEYLRAMPVNRGDAFDTAVLQAECEIAYDMRDLLASSLEYARCSAVHSTFFVVELCALHRNKKPLRGYI